MNNPILKRSFHISGEKRENQQQIKMLAKHYSRLSQGNFFSWSCIPKHWSLKLKQNFHIILQAMGMAMVLDETINYVHSLQNQVEVRKMINFS